MCDNLDGKKAVHARERVLGCDWFHLQRCTHWHTTAHKGRIPLKQRIAVSEGMCRGEENQMNEKLSRATNCIRTS